MVAILKIELSLELFKILTKFCTAIQCTLASVC